MCPDPIITNRDVGNVVLENASNQDDTFTAGGAGTLAEGTILGRLTADGKLGLFEKGVATGLETPVAVITYDVPLAGAGDVAVRPMIAGKVRKEKLIIAAGGDTTVDNVVVDQLKDSSIVALSVIELAQLDNQ